MNRLLSGQRQIERMLSRRRLANWQIHVAKPIEPIKFALVEECALEERERARLLERDYDRHVLLQKGEARFAPLDFFNQVAVERDLA
jgi:hypothetical protein